MKKGRKNTSPKSLLLVSGDNELKRYITGALARADLPLSTLATATRGQDALRMLVRDRLPLVVLDDELPDTTGVDFLRALREEGIKTLVVYVTALHTLELEREVRQVGVLYYTEKPPDPEVIERIVVAALSLSGKDTQP